MLFTDTLAGPMQAEKWGVTTQNKDFVFVHIFEKPSNGLITIPGKYNAATILVMNNGSWIKGMDTQDGLQIDIAQLTIESPALILKVAKK